MLAEVKKEYLKERLLRLDRCELFNGIRRIGNEFLFEKVGEVVAIRWSKDCISIFNEHILVEFMVV